MKKAAGLAAILALAGTPALLAQTSQQPAPAQQPSMGQVTTPKFVEMAAMSDMFEIESSRLALEKSQNAEIRRFAEDMVQDHAKASDILKKTAEASDLQVPAKLSGRYAERLGKLGAASGQAFERIYAQMQVWSHQEALQLHRGYGQNGDNPALKLAAQQMVPVVQEHLAEAQRLMEGMRPS